MRELLDAGAPVDDYGSDTAAGVTPLMESVDELESFYDGSRLVLTQLLLSAGADVARRDNTERTAMHYAVGAGRMAVEVLLAAGSDANAADDRGVTPLHEAILRGNTSAIEALCLSGANCGTPDHTGRTPADLLSENERVFTSEELAAVSLLLGST
ncbi:ankyrin repeat domain-containing protein [Paenarthrobacter sp. NPDC089989]|uniref:ankyrin repeat domain-containing protein n=1 Tax=unclassified Paenarthrobacter TaxID=2634190 RepID=UPI0037F2A3F6